MKRPTDFELSQGCYSSTMFVISQEGKLWRRRNDPCDPGDFACHGEVKNPTEERCKKLLDLLRNARPERPPKRRFANIKQTREILQQFNENSEI